MTLTTERLYIRKLTIEDTPFFYELVNDPDWIRFIGDRKVNTLKDAQNYLENKIIPSYTEWSFGFYLVIEKETKTSIGISGFVKRKALDYPDVGFAFLPKGRGKGYAFESTQALMKWGKDTLNLQTILAIANKDNIHSHRLLEKLGLKFEHHIQLYDEEEEICLFST